MSIIDEGSITRIILRLVSLGYHLGQTIFNHFYRPSVLTFFQTNIYKYIFSWMNWVLGWQALVYNFTTKFSPALSIYLQLKALIHLISHILSLSSLFHLNPFHKQRSCSCLPTKMKVDRKSVPLITILAHLSSLILHLYLSKELPLFTSLSG